MIEFIFMLTHNDATVPEALEICQTLSKTGLSYVGFKDVGADQDTLAKITRVAHDAGMEVMLEVVSVSFEDELTSLRAALDIGVDWVLGGTHAVDGAQLLAGTSLRYCPFPGRVIGHPSVLHGDVAEIADDARRLTSMAGVYGLDLLAYRHPDAYVENLVAAVVQASTGPVIVAGSVASERQIRALAAAGAFAFTIGGAIMEGCFAGAPDIAAQVSSVLAIAETT